MQEDDGFRIPCVDVTACSRAPVPAVFIPEDLWSSVISLCREIKGEWFGYLTGARTEVGNFEVDALYFPPQSAGAAHVHPIPELTETRPLTIGAIHSHADMPAKFSSVDTAHANWPLEVVVNRRGDYELTVRTQLPCGSWIRGSGKLQVVSSPTTGELLTTARAALTVGDAHERAKRPPDIQDFRSFPYEIRPRHFPQETPRDETPRDKKALRKCAFHGCGHRKVRGSIFCAMHGFVESRSFAAESESDF